MILYSLKAVRVNLGLTLDEAADRIGISKYTLFNYEHYKTVPKADNIRKIEAAYDINYNELRFVPNEKEKKNFEKKRRKKQKDGNG